MHRFYVIPALLLLLGLSGARAEDTDFDFEQLMEDVEFNLNEMQASITLEETDEALAFAARLKADFRRVEVFFAAWGYADDAVKYSQEYQERADRVTHLLQAGDFNQAYDVSVEFSDNCKACHDMYKPL